MMNKKKIVLFSSIGSFAILIFIVIFLTVFLPKINKNKQWEEQVKQYYEDKIELYEQENSKYDDYEVDIACLGDSLTDGYDVCN